MIITHPNRDKPVVQATRATVILLLLVSAGLVLIVTIGGWNVLESAARSRSPTSSSISCSRSTRPAGTAACCRWPPCSRCCSRSSRWSPAPAWFARDKTGFEQPDYLNAGLIGVLTLLIVPVQILLVAFAMRGFSQGWNVELERRDPAAGAETYRRRAAAPGLSAPGYPRLVRPSCGGGGTVDAGPSKGLVRKGVWVRIPPAAPFGLSRDAWTGEAVDVASRGLLVDGHDGGAAEPDVVLQREVRVRRPGGLRRRRAAAR